MVLLAQMQPNFAVKTLHTKLPNLVKVFDDKISAGPKLFNLFLLQRKTVKNKTYLVEEYFVSQLECIRDRPIHREDS